MRNSIIELRNKLCNRTASCQPLLASRYFHNCKTKFVNEPPATSRQLPVASHTNSGPRTASR